MKKLLIRFSLFIIMMAALAAIAVTLLSAPYASNRTIFLVITGFALVGGVLGAWIILPPIVELIRSKMKESEAEEELFP